MRRMLLYVACAGALLAWAPAAGAARSPMIGIYEARISSQSTVLNGTWIIDFGNNGLYVVEKVPKKTVLIGGGWSATATTLSMTDQLGPLACKGSQAHAVYRWTRSRTKLSLHAVRDTCSGRAAILAGSFTKVG